MTTQHEGSEQGRAEYTDCHACDGTGRYAAGRDVAWNEEAPPCEDCDGTGRMPTKSPSDGPAYEALVRLHGIITDHELAIQRLKDALFTIKANVERFPADDVYPHIAGICQAALDGRPIYEAIVDIARGYDPSRDGPPIPSAPPPHEPVG